MTEVHIDGTRLIVVLHIDFNRLQAGDGVAVRLIRELFQAMQLAGFQFHSYQITDLLVRIDIHPLDRNRLSLGDRQISDGDIVDAVVLAVNSIRNRTCGVSVLQLPVGRRGRVGRSSVDSSVLRNGFTRGRKDMIRMTVLHKPVDHIAIGLGKVVVNVVFGAGNLCKRGRGLIRIVIAGERQRTVGIRLADLCLDRERGEAFYGIRSALIVGIDGHIRRVVTVVEHNIDRIALVRRRGIHGELAIDHIGELVVSTNGCAGQFLTVHRKGSDLDIRRALRDRARVLIAEVAVLI